MRLIYTLLICIGFGASLLGQVALVPLPNIGDQFRLDQIWNLSAIVGGNGLVKGHLNFVIEDDQRNLVYAATLANISLKPGSNSVQQLANTGALGDFGNINAAKILRQTGALPYGEFIVCYFFRDEKNTTILGEYCFEKGVKPMLPPELLQPYDKEEINVTTPLLVWKAPFPTIASAQLHYALRLVEVKKNQSPSEAIERNAPIMERQVVDQTQLLYPTDAPFLKKGSTYAWKTTVRAGSYTVGTTDVWTFKVETVEVKPKNDSYRMLADEPSGSVYVARNGILRFAYDNRYGQDSLRYTVTAIQEGPKDGFTKANAKALPAISLKAGMNKIDLNLKEHNIAYDKIYLLCVKQQGHGDQFIEFKFKKDEN